MPHTLHLLLLLAYHDALFSLFAIGGGVSMLIPQMHPDAPNWTPAERRARR